MRGACHHGQLGGHWLQSGQDPCEPNCCVYHCLSHTPHSGMDRNHAEIAMFVHESYSPRGKESQGHGDDQAHQEDHDTVESAQLVPSEGCECNDGCDAVDDCTGEDAPSENRHPHLVEELNSDSGLEAQN